MKTLLLGFFPGIVLGYCNALGLVSGFEALMREPFDPIGAMVSSNMVFIFRLSSVPAAFFVGLFTALLVHVRYMRPSELIGAATGAIAGTFVVTPYGPWGVENAFIMIMWTPIGTAVGWIAGKIVGMFLSRDTLDGPGYYWKDFD